MAERFRELDGLRGLAALAVVVYHFTGAYDELYPGGPASPFYAWWGMFGVQLFFMISGFVILMTAQRARRPADFAVSRLSRLYPAYWLALSVTLVIIWIFQVPREPLSWWQTLLNYTMIQRWLLVPNVDDVYWTLAIEMQFYVLIFLLLLVTRCRLTPRVVTVAALAWSAVGLATAIWAYPRAHGLNPQLVGTVTKVVLNVTVAEWAPLFAAGMFAYLSRSDARYRPLALLNGAVAVVTCGLIQDWQSAAVVAAMVVVFLSVAFRRSTPLLLWRPVQFYGRLSYSLYIGHAIPGPVMIHALVPFVGRVPTMAIALVGVTAVAWVIHELGEARGTRLLKQWLQARLGSAAGRIVTSG